jgi:hypothetical protein
MTGPATRTLAPVRTEDEPARNCLRLLAHDAHPGHRRDDARDERFGRTMPLIVAR